MSISDNIKAIRTQKSIAQAEVARRLDIEPSSYHRLENRGSKLTIEQAESIANALGVSLLELLTWGEEKESDEEETQGMAQVQKENKNLKNRIDELEDRVHDKSEIIENIKWKYEAVKSIANEAILSPIIDFALEHNIGRVSIRNKIDNTSKIISMEEYDSYEDLDSDTSAEYVESIRLTDEEILPIIKLFMENKIYKDLFNEMMTEKEIVDTQLIKVYKKWSNSQFINPKRSRINTIEEE